VECLVTYGIKVESRKPNCGGHARAQRHDRQAGRVDGRILPPDQRGIHDATGGGAQRAGRVDHGRRPHAVFPHRRARGFADRNRLDGR